MEHRSKEPLNDKSFDLSSLLHPAGAFAHPRDVVRDPGLTVNEKRAILASWASDACAIEAAPALRMNAAGTLVSWDEIMDALRTLDREAAACGRPPPHYKRVLAGKDAGLPGIPSRPRATGGPTLN